MALLISFLIGIQLFHAVFSVPLPLFLSPSCNSLEVRTAAEVALNKLNANRREGYVLGLQRIFDAQEVTEGDESVFNLVLDVLETKCHVRSGKSWKECEFREPHNTVFGYCEIILRFNRKTDDSFLHRSDCILRPHSVFGCPDCPQRRNTSEDSFQEAARESLAKFNAENNHKHYFAVLDVTKASSQWVFGPSSFVEYTIQETSCPKSTPVPDINQCCLLPTETAEAGLCKGSVSSRSLQFEKIVTVECDFFPPPPSVKNGQTSQSVSENQELHHPHVTVTETPPKQKEAEVQVIEYHSLSNHDVPKVSSTSASPQQEVKPTIPPYPKGLSESAECPGTVAKEIYGLLLPLRQRAETSQTKSDVSVIAVFFDSAKISKMALLISFLIGIQLFHAVASVPLPQFLHPSCNSLEVKTAAELALNKHNAYKTEGYVLGLQRISDAEQVSEQDGDSVFFLILDVLETKCHVLSKKLWKECEFRRPHETVFGQCKVIIKVNRNSNDTFLYRNDCILRPHSSPVCPGCPIRQNPSEERFQEIAKESLAKFNAENGHHRYFALGKVTKATSQVVHGILDAIEFTIQETSCHKSTPVSDLTQCTLLPSETAEKGLCKGSVIGRGDETPKTVTANCEIFPHRSGSEHQELHHPDINATETPSKEKEAVVEVIDHPSSTHDVPEVSPSSASPQKKAKSTIPPFPKGFSQSASCPGEVAIEIPGLQLPSPPQAETSPIESDVQQ
ncbi:uncharacterized protein LOC131201334 [Ahaetulla prasina]|uniref:uncharacterized protein LOC131201334 n=1 Tax=Ahaetulla prasina TaxID=499056 RepID=UPI00264939B3|nr:uncharacterized protein LOC131201334 [Ahaetulla prasina]